MRFFAPPSDTNATVIDCAGQSNAYRLGERLVHAGLRGRNRRRHLLAVQCLVRTSGAGATLTVNLIPNVTNISVLYGVGSNTAGDDYSIKQYLNASQMSAINWLNVTAVKVTLTFLVPSYGQSGGQMTTSTTTFQRVIPIMSRAGVDT